MHVRVWVCFVIGICLGSKHVKDRQGSEYAWVCSWIMLDWICPEYASISEYFRVVNILASKYVRVTQGSELVCVIWATGNWVI